MRDYLSTTVVFNSGFGKESNMGQSKGTLCHRCVERYG